MAKGVAVVALPILVLYLIESSQADPLGSPDNPVRSCRNIALGNVGAKNGIYYLTGAGGEPFPVYCDIRSGGYTMVYKLVGGVRGRAADLWTKPGTVNDEELAALNPNNIFKGHYKSVIVDRWRLFRPQEVAIVLYSGGQEMIRFVFNARLSSSTNWFSKSHLISSPYSDIDSSPQNYFSLLGHTGKGSSFNLDRNFFINRNFGGCPNDTGWLAVISGEEDVCSWARGKYIRILYSQRSTVANWNRQYEVEDADVLAVFVR
jgi:hypothetical protein